TLGLTTEHIAWVADRNTHKHGRLMPGTHQAVVPVERIAIDQPPALLLLAWNFADEIADQQHAYLEGGGRLLVPLPELREIIA
ncbi:MAG: methyltransferase, partial [Planctomycetota bacterium]